MPTSTRRHDASATVDAIRRIVRFLRVAARQTELSAGVSAAQLFVLGQLQHAHANSLSELGQRTLTDRSSVAAVVDRLASVGLVKRVVSDEDRRRTTIHITSAGRALLKRAPQPPTTLLIDGLHRLGDTELRQLARSLEVLIATMGLADTPAPFLFDDGVTPHKPRATKRRNRPGRYDD